MTAEEFGAAEALRIGLVQEVVPHGKHVETRPAIAKIIAEQAPLGVQGTLANARVAATQGTAAADRAFEGTARAHHCQRRRAEGVKSFVERRTATFRGR